jgi:hypothetical protein
MSKQANKIHSVLKVLFNDVECEVDISKISKVKSHRGIRVDFYIPSLNIVLECHGIQHEKAQSFGMSEQDAYRKFNMQLNRDSKLRQICLDFNINYEEIWYNEKVDLPFIYSKLGKYLKDEERI